MPTERTPLPSPERQQQIQDLLLSLATAFIDPDLLRIDFAIQQALADVAQFLGADRSYLLTYNFATQTGTQTHEWCAQGVEPRIEPHRGISLADHADWVAPHARGDTLSVADVDQLPAGGLKCLLQDRGLKSTLALPLMDGSHCLGCVGFDATRATLPDLPGYEPLLSVFTRLLVKVRRRQKANLGLYVTKTVQRDTQGHTEYLAGLGVDIANDLAKQRALATSEERLRMALAAAKQAWFEVDVSSGQVTLSPEYPELIGHDLTAQASDMATWKAHVHPEDRERAMAVFQRVVSEGGPLSADYRRETSTGGWKWLRSVGKVSERDAQGKPLRVVGIHTDIHELKTHELQLERMAHFDALTGLPNRVLLADRLHQAMVQAQRYGRTLAVLYLDLDGFKGVNDAHGHGAGDQLLKVVSLRLGAALREGDTIARLGGDEFVAVLQDVPDLAACRPVLERLLAAARQPLALGDTPVTISASLGMTFFPQSEDVDGDHLLRQADQAMYQAKLLGKNRFAVFDTAQAREVQGRQQTLHRLREALTNGEFVLHFQPQVNMRTGEVVGAEALIRWQHPTDGLLGPAAFLPALTGHALAIEVGEWVLATALRTLLDWRAAGLELPVSVNVDAQQLQHPDFVPTLQALLQAHPGVRPGDLELEVVESSALDDVEQAGQTMAQCAALGVGFALDDFGTGYASLTYLRRLPAGLLKIDQSFVRDMLDDPDDLALMKGVIGLANAFRRQVIAEGVETAEQATVLLAMGCDWGQGFGIARPMPGADLPAWVASWQPPADWQRHTA